MAQISDQTLATIRNEVTRLRATTASAVQRARGHAAGKTESLKAVGEATLAAGAVGYMRGKFQKDGGVWEVMGVDIELLIGLALVGIPLSGIKTGLPNRDLENAGIGVLSHFVGQVARGYATTKNFRLVAGAPQLIGTQGSGQSFFGLPHPNEQNWDNDAYDSDMVGGLASATSF